MPHKSGAERELGEGVGGVPAGIFGLAPGWEGPEGSTGRFPVRTECTSRMCSKLPNCTMGQEGVGLSSGNKEKMHSCSQDFKVEDEELLCKWTGISWVNLSWVSVFFKAQMFYYFCLKFQAYINLMSSPPISSSWWDQILISLKFPLHFLALLSVLLTLVSPCRKGEQKGNLLLLIAYIYTCICILFSKLQQSYRADT